MNEYETKNDITFNDSLNETIISTASVKVNDLALDDVFSTSAHHLHQHSGGMVSIGKENTQENNTEIWSETSINTIDIDDFRKTLDEIK